MLINTRNVYCIKTVLTVSLIFCLGFSESDKTKDYVKGVDVSRYQGELNWNRMSADSINFAICKATEGETYTDPEFNINWNKIKEAGLIRGAYHFYRTNDNVKTQAENFINAINKLESNDLPCILDIEQGSIIGAIDKQELNHDILQWLKIIEQKTLKKPIIYTSLHFANEYLTDTSLANYPLWLAEYTNSNTPNIPKLWSEKGWVFWQKSCKKKEDGFSENFDFDLFNGDLNELHKFLKQDIKK